MVDGSPQIQVLVGFCSKRIIWGCPKVAYASHPRSSRDHVSQIVLLDYFWFLHGQNDSSPSSVIQGFVSSHVVPPLAVNCLLLENARNKSKSKTTSWCIVDTMVLLGCVIWTSKNNVSSYSFLPFLGFCPMIYCIPSPTSSNYSVTWSKSIAHITPAAMTTAPATAKRKRDGSRSPELARSTPNNWLVPLGLISNDM